jgi:hypothetical protein
MKAQAKKRRRALPKSFCVRGSRKDGWRVYRGRGKSAKPMKFEHHGSFRYKADALLVAHWLRQGIRASRSPKAEVSCHG